MNIKIEKGIPIPPPIGRKTSGVIDLIRKMKIGESFIWEGMSMSNIYVYARLAGVKIATRSMPDGTRRVWRTE